jgi:hypothetical protein
VDWSILATFFGGHVPGSQSIPKGQQRQPWTIVAIIATTVVGLVVSTKILQDGITKMRNWKHQCRFTRKKHTSPGTTTWLLAAFPSWRTDRWELDEWGVS